MAGEDGERELPAARALEVFGVARGHRVGDIVGVRAPYDLRCGAGCEPLADLLAHHVIRAPYKKPLHPS